MRAALRSRDGRVRGTEVDDPTVRTIRLAEVVQVGRERRREARVVYRPFRR